MDSLQSSCEINKFVHGGFGGKTIDNKPIQRNIGFEEPGTDFKPVTPPSMANPPPAPGVLFIPITVIRTPSSNVTIADREAKIMTRSSNGSLYYGQPADPEVRPYYTGAAYARIPKPDSNAQVKATIFVQDAIGKNCTALCLEGNQYNYCEPSVILDSDPQKSDKIPWATNVVLAKYLNWHDHGKNLDKFMFICKQWTF